MVAFSIDHYTHPQASQNAVRFLGVSDGLQPTEIALCREIHNGELDAFLLLLRSSFPELGQE